MGFVCSTDMKNLFVLIKTRNYLRIHDLGKIFLV